MKLSASIPPDQKPKYIDLFKEFQDVFAWGYEDLKSYDTYVIQHTIPLKPNQKPFKKKLRRINPMLLPSIEKELQKMFKVGIIAPIKFSEGMCFTSAVKQCLGLKGSFHELENVAKL